MKKLIFFSILSAILAMACGETTHKGYHYFTNKTGKRLVHELIYDYDRNFVNYDTVRFFSDGLTTETEFEWEIIAIQHPNSKDAHYRNTYIYCIDDTVSLLWHGLYYYELDSNYFESILIEINKRKERIIEYYLTIDDSIVSTMQKDYSMLEKFSEYYGN